MDSIESGGYAGWSKPAMRSLTSGIFVRTVEGAVGNAGLRARRLGKRHQAVIFQMSAFPTPSRPGLRPAAELGPQHWQHGVHIAALPGAGPAASRAWFCTVTGHRVCACPRDCGCDGNEPSESSRCCLGACTGSSPALRDAVLLYQGSYMPLKQAFNKKCISQCIPQCIVLQIASHFWVKTHDLPGESS